MKFLLVTTLIFFTAAVGWSKSDYAGQFFSVRKLDPATPGLNKISATPAASYDPQILVNSLDSVLAKEAGLTMASTGVRLMDIRDLDGDSLDEAAVTTPKGLFYITLNSRSFTFTEYRNLFSSVFLPVYPATYRSTLRLGDFLSFSDAAVLATRPGSKKRFFYQDINGDRKLDAVLVTKNTTYILINNNMKFTKAAELDDYPDPSFSDINQDGIMDILSPEPVMRVMKVALLDQNYTKTEMVFPKKDILGALFSDDFSVYTARLENQPASSVVMITRPMFGNGKLTAYRYDSARKEFVSFVSNSDIPSQVEFVDFDKDGIDEMIARNGPMNIYKLSGSSFSNIRYEAQPVKTTSKAVWDDFNNDSRPDFLLLNTGGVFSTSFLYLNISNSWYGREIQNVPVTAVAADPTVSNSQPSLAENYLIQDINRDGFKDLTAWKAGNLSVYTNSGGKGMGLFFSENSGTPEKEFADINNDGMPDYVTYQGGDPKIYINSGKAMVRIRNEIPKNIRQVVCTDIDGDELADLIIIGEAGFFNQKGVYFYRGTDKTVFEEFKGEMIPLESLDASISVGAGRKVMIIDNQGKLVYMSTHI